MENQYQRLIALNQAIWIRDNAQKTSKADLVSEAQELSYYGLFSNRQISKISGGALSPSVLNASLSKNNKTGGRLSPENLEDILLILFSKERGAVDHKLIKKVLDNGTSQGMISRLTGISQSSISRKSGEKNS